jgi:hypothetical protein
MIPPRSVETKCGVEGINNMALELKLYNKKKPRESLSLISFLRNLLSLSIFYLSGFYSPYIKKGGMSPLGGLKMSKPLGDNNGEI